MPKQQPKDHIGFDPMVWVSRLKDVNDGSQFHADEKKIIEKHLSAMEHDLWCHKTPASEQ